MSDATTVAELFRSLGLSLTVSSHPEEDEAWACTLTRADGVSFTGVWRNGCFRQGARWSVFLTTTKECGFE